MSRDDQLTRALVRESAAIALQVMPELSREVLRLGRAWDEQEMLDPTQAKRTAELIQAQVATLTPQLGAVRRRQDDIARELRDLIGRESER